MTRNVEQLGQVFTPPKVVAFMLDLCTQQRPGAGAVGR